MRALVPSRPSRSWPCLGLAALLGFSSTGCLQQLTQLAGTASGSKTTGASSSGGATSAPGSNVPAGGGPGGILQQLMGALQGAGVQISGSAVGAIGGSATATLGPGGEKLPTTLPESLTPRPRPEAAPGPKSSEPSPVSDSGESFSYRAGSDSLGATVRAGR